jgi:hypothetical protein
VKISPCSSWPREKVLLGDLGAGGNVAADVVAAIAACDPVVDTIIGPPADLVAAAATLAPLAQSGWSLTVIPTTNTTTTLVVSRSAIVLTATPVVIGKTIEPGRLGQQVGGHASTVSASCSTRTGSRSSRERRDELGRDPQ